MNAATQILRAKVIALLFGASGIGLLGIFSNFTSMLALLCGLGVGTGAIKQLSAHANNSGVFLSIWKTTAALSFALALIAIVVGYLISDVASNYLTDGASKPRVFFGLALISALTIILASLNAYLRAKGLVRQSARLISWATLAGTLLAIILAHGLSQEWFIVSVLMLPVLVQLIWALRDVIIDLGSLANAFRDSPVVRKFGREAVTLGVPIVLSTLVGASAQLYLRAEIVQNLGLEQAGLFQASWAISVGVIGIFLTSIWGDLFPRLAARQSEFRALETIVADQNRMFIALLSLPFLALTAMPSLALILLFSAEFAAAAELLRVQLVGDALKVIAWPLAMLFVSQGRAAVFLAAEVVWSTAMLASFHLLIDRYGLLAANIGYVFAYACYLVFLAFYAKKCFGISIRVIVPQTFLLPLMSLVAFAFIQPELSKVSLVLTLLISIAMFLNLFLWYRGVSQDRELLREERTVDEPK